MSFFRNREPLIWDGRNGSIIDFDISSVFLSPVTEQRMKTGTLASDESRGKTAKQNQSWTGIW